MKNVVEFNPGAKEAEQRKQDLLEVVDTIRAQIEAGDIKEFVACSLSKDGVAQIHASVLDLVGGVGLFEMGKVMLVNTQDEIW
jgi:uncharacterized protein YqeY